MISRQEQRARIEQRVNIQMCPEHIRPFLEQWLVGLPSTEKIAKTELLRRALVSGEVAALDVLTNEQLGAIFRCSATIPQRVRSAPREPSQEPRKGGRPSILGAEEEARLVEWVRSRSSVGRWVSMREFKLRVIEVLEDRHVETFPSRHFYGDLVQRLLGDEFEKRAAETLEVERSEVTEQDLTRYFDVLRGERLEQIHPDLLINIDETGFGGSRSGRLKPTKVIVPKTIDGRIFVGAEKTGHYISAICAITAGGQLLPPALITKRKTLPDDLWTLPLGSKTRIYSSEKAFVTRRIFQSYLRDTVIPYIDEVRERIQKPDMKAYLIWDGHSSHYDDLTGSFAALNNVSVISIPPHSSHLTQPLDREFFLKVKKFYSFYTARSDLPKISGRILRVIQSLFSAATLPTIVTSWAMTGIVPIIINGSVSHVALSPRNITLPTRVPVGEQDERGRSRRRVAYSGPGVLNEDQQMFFEANVCPFCMAPLTDAQASPLHEGPA